MVSSVLFHLDCKDENQAVYIPLKAVSYLNFNDIKKEVPDDGKDDQDLHSRKHAMHVDLHLLLFRMDISMDLPFCQVSQL